MLLEKIKMINLIEKIQSVDIPFNPKSKGFKKIKEILFRHLEYIINKTNCKKRVII